MKTLALICLLTILAPVGARSEPVAEKVESTIAALIPDGWSFRSDGRNLVGSVAKIRLLNPISLPFSSSEDEIWKEYSWESDFNVVVRITPKIDAKGYAALVKLRSDLLERRIRDWEKERGEKIGGKSRYVLEKEIRSIVPLPYCHSESHSIWITTTDAGLLKTRPKTAREFSDALRKALAELFTLYKTDP